MTLAAADPFFIPHCTEASPTPILQPGTSQLLGPRDMQREHGCYLEGPRAGSVLAPPLPVAPALPEGSLEDHGLLFQPCLPGLCGPALSSIHHGRGYS